MTVSALCRLRPRPPARVESIKMKWGELGALNCASRSPRSSPLVFPSSRRWQYLVRVRVRVRVGLRLRVRVRGRGRGRGQGWGGGGASSTVSSGSTLRVGS